MFALIQNQVITNKNENNREVNKRIQIKNEHKKLEWVGRCT